VETLTAPITALYLRPAMVNMKKVVECTDAMRANIDARHMDVDLDAVIATYQGWLAGRQRLEALQMQANDNARALQGPKEPAECQALVQRGRAIKLELGTLKEAQARLDQEAETALASLPNWMAAEVPLGSGEDDNRELRRHLAPTQFDFVPKDHMALMEALNLADFQAGAKVTGPKFYFLKNELVLLQHAVKSYAFKVALTHGFTCLHTPDLVRNSILQGIGFAPRGPESNTYAIEGEDLSLVATAEIAVGGMHADELLDVASLPLLYVAESHCFRKESGAAGRASKGLYRVHQFEKVELFAFCTPEQSSDLHEKLMAIEESIYQGLGIPYRVVLNCAADLGAPAYKKYDIEAWMPGKGSDGAYGEVTSSSNCTDYQARRLRIRYKNPDTGRNEFVHTLNGTAVALSRTLLAILENYQTADGAVLVPAVLRPYVPFEIISMAH
jgi:seryl-tRNA synthetase